MFAFGECSNMSRQSCYAGHPMPYASEAMRRAHKRASASHARESAAAEIDRVVALVHRDLSKARQNKPVPSDWSSLIAYAKASEIRAVDDRA